MTRTDRAEVSLLRYQLDKPVGGSGVATIDVVVDLTDSDGVQGLGFTYVLGGTGGEIVLAAARIQPELYSQPAVGTAPCSVAKSRGQLQPDGLRPESDGSDRN